VLSIYCVCSLGLRWVHRTFSCSNSWAPFFRSAILLVGRRQMPKANNCFGANTAFMTSCRTAPRLQLAIGRASQFPMMRYRGCE